FNITLRKPNATITCYFQLAGTTAHGIPSKDCSANIESLGSERNKTIYKFTPPEDVNGIKGVYISWDYIINPSTPNIVFRGELDDIKNNYPDRDIQKYIDYLQNYYIFPQENLNYDMIMKHSDQTDNEESVISDELTLN
ncbi:8777_t:CDS:2, partial [Entrophospora sp. SA101]